MSGPRPEPTEVSELWLPRPDVRSHLEEDGGVLIDLRTGKYHALNRVGALIWSRLEAGAPRRAILERLRQRYPETAGRLAGDLDAWLRQLAENGLLAPAAPEALPVSVAVEIETAGSGSCAAPAAALPEGLRRELEAALASGGTPPGRLRRALWFVRAWGWLLLADLALRGLGFPRFQRLVDRVGVRRRGRCDPGELAALCATVDAAARWYFKRAWCLQRSAVAVAMLRGKGFPVELVIGVRRVPFLAHAWVEWGGVVVNGDRRTADFYRPLARCRPAGGSGAAEV